SEKQKMVAGELYLAADPELVAERAHCEQVLRDYNTRGEASVLQGLLGAVGKDSYIRPPFFCDYGYNITLGDNVFMNFNCVVLDVLSNRADLISAGDALVAISYGDAVNPADIRVELGGSDITSAFAVRENGRFEGLVTGLGLCPNTLQALLPSGQGAALTITN